MIGGEHAKCREGDGDDFLMSDTHFDWVEQVTVLVHWLLIAWRWVLMLY